ncbi:MAG TPA: GNAT family N-acetyltransferase [Acidimicrobiales bacterium]|nr:GNAT family N-acetyltransferase [Acidimicrobiales bacterium]
MPASSLEIRAFRRSTDLAAVAELWATALAPERPVLADGLELLRGGYIAVRDERCVGMIGVAVDDVEAVAPGRDGGAGPRDASAAAAAGEDAGPGPDGAPTSSVRFIAGAPDERRRGIATRLVEHALGDLRRMGVHQVAAGSGAGPYIWPGVPLDRPDAVGFFDALGWEEPHVVTDLTADLRTDGLDEQLAGFGPPAGISLAVVTPAQRSMVLDFEDANFPQWSRSFREPGNDVLVAYDGAGEVVGSLLLSGPGRSTVYWPMLGEDSAEIACVGVAASQENRGVGSAMVARASQVLRSRGAGVCHIGWAVRVGFYSRVGYRPWRRYSMRNRTL